MCHRASVAHLPFCVTFGKNGQFSYLYGTQKGDTMTTTSEAVELFLASLRTRSAPANTIKAYAHDLMHFVQAVPAALASVSAPAIQTFLDGDGHHSPATRGRRYSTLCALYRWLVRQELAQSNPMERLDPIVQPRKEPRPLKPDIVEQIDPRHSCLQPA
jgi:site-specific recombinase XerD